MIATQLSRGRASGAALFFILCWFVPAGCAPPLRTYTSPALRAAHQRPRTIAILPIYLTVSSNEAAGTEQITAPATSKATMFQQMLYSMLLQQGRRRPIVIRNIDQNQLPVGEASLTNILPLARQWGVEALLVTRLHHTHIPYSAAPSTITVYNDAAATATTTSTGPAVTSFSEVLLDMALYDLEGQLLWKYNGRATPLLPSTTAGRLTERLMEEGLGMFPFRR
jgi:hypothetical protein